MNNWCHMRAFQVAHTSRQYSLGITPSQSFGHPQPVTTHQSLEPNKIASSHCLHCQCQTLPATVHPAPNPTQQCHIVAQLWKMSRGISVQMSHSLAHGLSTRHFPQVSRIHVA